MLDRDLSSYSFASRDRQILAMMRASLVQKTVNLWSVQLKSSCAAVMTHKWHPYKNGVLFESRFWIGYRMDEDGNVVKAIPEGVSIPPIVPQGLFAHNIKEFTNLAANSANLI